MQSEDYLDINKKSWNLSTPVHLESAFYNVPAFVQGENSLNSIELELLGNVAGKSILHLQCHFGQDTISLARLGAKVTGVDFSNVAITEARKLAEACEVDCRFMESDVYALPEKLSARFDLVFTSYGTIGWLPDLDKWAQVIQQFLVPGGRFVFAEFHPVIWMFNENMSSIEYPYFNRGPIFEEKQGTYAQPDSPVESRTITWNHGLSEVFAALERNGMRLLSFAEYDYSPYDCLAGMKARKPGEFVFEKFPGMLPIVYSLMAEKK